jgi:hypothetical protein
MHGTDHGTALNKAALTAGQETGGPSRVWAAKLARVRVVAAVD